MVCNFSNVIKIILEHLREDMPAYDDGNHGYTQITLIHGLFDSYYLDTDLKLEESVVSRWINGSRPVSSEIVNYYRDKDNREIMTENFEDYVFPYLFDFDMAIDDLYRLLTNDREHLSSKIRRKLSRGYPFEDDHSKCKFVTDLICTMLDGKGVIGKKMLTSNEIVIAPTIYGANPPPVCRYFCGRDKELEEVHSSLKTEKNIFISGFAGIGKSEFAKAFAAKYKKEYRNIYYFTYTNSLENMIASIDHSDDTNGEDKQTRFNNHHSFLNGLGDDTLIIIDNFNITSTDDPFLNKILNYRCKIIFTTRSNFEDEFTYTLNPISDTNTLIDLFGKYYLDTSDNLQIVTEIIEAVHHHTLSVEMSAKLLQKGIHTPEEILKHLKANSAEPESSDKIKITKDGSNIKETYYNHIRTLFSLHLLSDEQKKVMMSMVVVPHNGIRIKMLAEYLKLDNLNDINDLVELGFITNTMLDIIALHPMVRDIAILDLKPSINNCEVFIQSINDKLLIQGIELPNGKNIISIIENIIRFMDKDNSRIYLTLLEDACGFIENYNSLDRLNVMNSIISEMQNALDDENIESESKDRALLLNYRAMLQRETSDDLDKALEFQKNALLFCDKENDPVLYANLTMNLALIYHEMNETDTALDLMHQAIYTLIQSQTFNNDLIVMALNYATILSENGHYQEALDILIECKHLTKGAVTVFHARMLYDIAAIYIMGNIPDKAIRHFNAAFSELESLGCHEECAYRKSTAAALLRNKGIEYPKKWEKLHLE